MPHSRRQARQDKRIHDGELRSEQNLTPNVDNNILKSITNQDGKVVSSPAGVKTNGKTDELILHNKILEAFISINILNDPGEIGIYLDQYAAKLSKVIHTLTFDNEMGNLPVVFNTKKTTLREVFKATTFNPLSVSSDQIGRMLKGVGQKHKIENKYEKKYKDKYNNEYKDTDIVAYWLYDKLNTPTKSSHFKQVLTKVKAISSFGTTIWQLLSCEQHAATNIKSLQTLFFASGLGNSDEKRKVSASFTDFNNKTRSSLFDNPVTRARSERMPLLNGSPINGVYSDAASHGLGFGQVVQSSHDMDETAQLLQLLSGGGAANSQINAIPRQNAPIGDRTRPYMLSETEFGELPKAYNAFNIRYQISKQRLFHGVGINRWQPYGTYGTQANLAGFPSAGAQSGGATDVMLALQMLSGGEIYSQKNSRAVEAITLAVAAFMNFGGYHTFSEVYPVGMSVANNEKLDPATTALGFRHSTLYLDMLTSYRKFNNKRNDDYITKDVLKFFSKYRAQTISQRNPTIPEE